MSSINLDSSREEDFQEEIIIKKKVVTEQTKQPQQQEIIDPKMYYDIQQKHTKTSRVVSRLIHLRKFQNWVKAALINEQSAFIKATLSGKQNLLNVCELGCGKGGDMTKWQRAGTGVWFGIDISGESLKEALNRHRTGEDKKKISKVYLMQASGNMDSTLFRSRLPQDLYFDFVSMQFMANLLFSSEAEVDNMFENITCRLAQNGLLLMTITDASVLVKKMRELGTRESKNQYVYQKNEYFSIKFDSLSFPKDKPWGLKYLFYLEDAVGFKENEQVTYVPEYLIEMQAFIAKAKSFNLELVEQHNFTDFYEKYKIKYKDLLNTMVKPPYNNWEMPMDMWEIVHLYRVVVFKHLKGQPQSKIRRHPNLHDLPTEHLELETLF